MQEKLQAERQKAAEVAAAAQAARDAARAAKRKWAEEFEDEMAQRGKFCTECSQVGLPVGSSASIFSDLHSSFAQTSASGDVPRALQRGGIGTERRAQL